MTSPTRIDLALGAMWTGRPAMQAGLSDTRAYLTALGALGIELGELNVKASNVGASVSQVNGALAQGSPGAKKLANDLDQAGDAVDDFADDVDDASDDIDKALDRWDKITGIAGFVVPYLQQAGQKLIQFTSESVAAASDNAEALSKFTVVFGDQAQFATERLEEIASAAGRSTNEFIALAAGLQDTFVPLGFARDRAAEMSTNLIQLALDMGSFDNVRTADVVRDLTSALVGNTESIRKYGIVANQAAIDQKALEMGLEFTKGAMDAQTKAAATLQIIYESTADAQGDAARTAHEHANMQRSLESATLDLKIAFGNLLIPAMTEGIDVATRWVNRLTLAVEIMGTAGQTVEELAEAGLASARANETLEEQLSKVNESYDLSRTFLGRFTGTQDEAMEAFLNNAQAIAATSESYDEFIARLEAAGVGSAKLRQILQQGTTMVDVSVEAWYELARVMDEALGADARLANYGYMYEEAHKGLIGYTEDLANSTRWQEYLTLAMNDTMTATDQLAITQEDMEEAEERRARWAEYHQEQIEAQIDIFDRWSGKVDGMRGMVAEMYELDGLSAQEAADQIAEANAAISESYKLAALEIAQQSIAAQYGEDALQAQEMYLQLQVAMGTITQEQADKLIEVAETTAEVENVTAKMMARYMEDGQLAQDEIDAIAAAVSLVEQNTYLSEEAIIAMAESGVTKFGEVEGAMEDTGDAALKAADAVAQVQSKIDLLEDKTVRVTVDVAQVGWSGIVEMGGVGVDETIGGGGRQHGGPVWPGTPFVVGEAGPEVFWPQTAGTIIPNEQIAGGGVMPSGGDTYNIVASSQESAALIMATIEERRRQELDAYMGVA